MSMFVCKFFTVIINLAESLFSPQNVHLIFKCLGLLRQAGQLFVTVQQIGHLALQHLSMRRHIISAGLQSKIHMTRTLNGPII